MQNHYWLSVKQLIGLLLVSISLVACTATFNWREIRSDEQGYSALFPAKSHLEQKKLPFNDHLIEISLETSSTDDAVFAIGSLKLDEKENSSTDLIKLMQLNAQRSIQQDVEPALLKTSFKLAGENNHTVEGEGFQLRGLSLDQKFRIYWVYWVKLPNGQQMTRVYQLTAMKAFKQKPSEKEINAMTEEFSTFIAGFKPY
jgi:hypothetical protein